MELKAGSRSGSTPRRVWALLGLFLSVGSLAFVAVVAPDDGLDTSSLQQGVGIATTVAAAPVALLLRPVAPWRGVALGGAMALAGFSIMFGGNLLGFLMGVGGAPILIVSAAREPHFRLGLAARLVGYATLLGAAMWLSLGEATLPDVLASVGLAAVVASSPYWDQPSADRPRANGETADPP